MWPLLVLSRYVIRQCNSGQDSAKESFQARVKPIKYCLWLDVPIMWFIILRFTMAIILEISLSFVQIIYVLHLFVEQKS